jgi:two-component system, response regulator
MNARTVLYVEDDEDDKELTLIHFREAGFDPEVVWTRNGEEALDFLRRGLRGEAPLPGLILADLKMPKMNGLELLAQVRANALWARIPFAFMTSSGDHRDKAQAERLGVTLYLEKPFSAEQYRSVVERLQGALRALQPSSKAPPAGG